MEKDHFYLGIDLSISIIPKVKKGIILVSGFGGDKNESHSLFSDFVPILNQNGFSTCRYNTRNNGDLYTTNLLTLREDFKIVHDYFKTQNKEIPIMVIGFSLGATISILESADISDMILLAPALDPKNDMLGRYKSNGEYQKAIDGTLERNRKKVSVNMLESFDIDLTDKIKEAECRGIIHSMNDQYIPHSTTERLISLFPKTPELYSPLGLSHSFRDKNDNKLSRMPVYDKIINWLNDR